MKLVNHFPKKHNVKLFEQSEKESRYTVRRRVINVLYEVNKDLQSAGLQRLPRIEVRVVKKADYAGMAYRGKKIIHITQSATEYNALKFRYVVWHEIVHGLGWGHREGCILMDKNPWPYWSVEDESRIWNTFCNYVHKFQVK